MVTGAEEGAAPDSARLTDLVLDIDGFEGPIDLLLTLAREQKVDLARISILQLAEQYVAFVQQARSLALELAAEYLVMASWLAYLKSRLLLPVEQTTEAEPSGAEMAAALAFQLQRLEAMQRAGRDLMARPRLGREVFANGQPEGIALIATPVYDLGLFDLLRAYGDIRARRETQTLEVQAFDLYSVEEAIRRLRQMLGDCPEWTRLETLLPAEVGSPLLWRSAVSAHFVAVLELARDGRLEVHQEGPGFAPILIRRKEARQ
ncbi:segregation and condensation protein A [Roseospirillum parvum]|uniref:Segregation and condensation protein A n=1 Tax=Roseospirillum parvum TaxID=83401 RepID=A0A1G7YHY8_9PROT|nr:ScpA family protein [Roseospirillum parvum]SDG96181.1 condensin subunit ScpA [Roseospirillum parvum]